MIAGVIVVAGGCGYTDTAAPPARVGPVRLTLYIGNSTKSTITWTNVTDVDAVFSWAYQVDDDRITVCLKTRSRTEAKKIVAALRRTPHWTKGEQDLAITAYHGDKARAKMERKARTV